MKYIITNIRYNLHQIKNTINVNFYRRSAIRSRRIYTLLFIR